MERTLYLLNFCGGTITETEACCFVKQLIKDLKSENPKIKWNRVPDAGWGTFFSTGLSGDSYIQLKSYRIKNQLVTCMLYKKGDVFVYTLQEFDGDPKISTHLSHLYKWAKASVRHRELYGDPMHKNTESQLSVEEMDDHCLKIIDIFRSLTAEQIVGQLMNVMQPSILCEDISESSPEWMRRNKMIRSLVKFLQQARIKESCLIVENSVLKDSDGKTYGNITSEPVAKWVNAYVIIKEAKYADLSSDEIRLKVASDIIANLLIDM